MGKKIHFKNFIGVVLRVTIGSVLAYVLILYTLRSTGTDLWIEILNSNKSLLSVALLLYGVIICVTIYRWDLLLRVQGLHLGGWDVVHLSMVGNFFNLALPGSVSGDIVKMSFVTRQTSQKKAEAMLTVLLDRVIGLSGLFVLAIIMMVYHLPFLVSLKQEFRAIQISALFVGLGGIAGICIIVLLEMRRSLMKVEWIGRVVHYGTQILPDFLNSIVFRLLNALELYRRYRSTTLRAVGLSILVHICLALDLFIIGASFGEKMIRLEDYFLLVSVSNAVAALPVTPGGIGTRDAMMVMFLIAMGPQGGRFGAIPVTMTLIILFWGLIGGISFALLKNPRSQVLLERPQV